MSGTGESFKYLEGMVEILRGLVDPVLERDRVAGSVGEPCVCGVPGTNPDLSLGSRHGVVRVGAAGSRGTTGAGEGHSEGEMETNKWDSRRPQYSRRVLKERGWLGGTTKGIRGRREKEVERMKEGGMIEPSGRARRFYTWCNQCGARLARATCILYS